MNDLLSFECTLAGDGVGLYGFKVVVSNDKSSNDSETLFSDVPTGEAIHGGGVPDDTGQSLRLYRIYLLDCH